jgi:hypothetical protein
MRNCADCNMLTCPHQGLDSEACSHFERDEPQYEAYTFDERTGSERIHLFYTVDARDAFVRRQPQWKMAH